ncbi:hypothetical protein HYT26_00880 [Candidatus Pacearchaeota archaeon]|nr:hypothetical protein [Candidatus Pacearchaeota archaeon]
MVYKRYVYKRGKRFGPYYYESYRDGDKVKKRYLGSHLPSSSLPEEKQRTNSNLPRNTPSIFQKRQFILPVLVVIFLLGFWLFYTHIGLTGKATLQISPSYMQGEAISGTLKLSLKQGELLPASTLISANLAGEQRQFLLSDLTTEAATEGSFYAENSQLSGSGSGYGIAGTKTTYPEISFKLKITKEKEEKAEAPVETPAQQPAETPSIPAQTKSQ